jgi:MFS transporter, DHA2 family, methylenomycin A resistance protein
MTDKTNTNRWLVLVIVCVAQFMVVLDATIVNVALPQIASAAALVAVERAAEQPLLPPALFRRPVFSTANAVAPATDLGSPGLPFVLTLYLQSMRHYSARGAGLALAPLFPRLSVLAPFGGRITARPGPRLPMALGLGAAAGAVATVGPVRP